MVPIRQVINLELVEPEHERGSAAFFFTAIVKAVEKSCAHKVRKPLTPRLKKATIKDYG